MKVGAEVRLGSGFVLKEKRTVSLGGPTASIDCGKIGGTSASIDCGKIGGTSASIDCGKVGGTKASIDHGKNRHH